MARPRRGCGYVDYEPIPTCLSISGNTLIYETNTGEVKNVQLPTPFSEVTFDPATCNLKYVDDNGTVTNIGLQDILLKSQDALVFNSDECTLKYTNVNGDCELWNVGAAIFDKLKDGSSWDADNCVLQQIDTSGNIQNFDLRSIIGKIATDLDWDEENCILTFTNATGTGRKVFNLTDILDKLCIFTNLEFDPATCVLKFTNPAGQCSIWDIGEALANKDEDKCYVHSYDPDTHTITLTETGSGNPVSVTALNCGSLALDQANCQLVYTNEKGGTDVIPIAKPSMTTTTDAEGNKTFCFSDGYGNTTCCDIPVVNLDTDNLVINGSTVTFTTGGDGNPGQVIFDVCDMVAANCNATFTNINSDGSWAFIDNAGNTFNWAPVITTLVDNGDSFTYVSEDGTVTNVDKCCTNVTEDADFYYITDHNGNQAVVCKEPVKDVVFNGVTYQPDASGSVVINYDPPVAPDDVVTTLVDNGGGSFTYVNEDGVPVTINFCEECPEVVGAGDINVTTSLGANGQTIYTVQYVDQAAADDIVTTLVDNGGSFTYVNEAGVPVTIDFCPVCPEVTSSDDSVTVTESVGPGGETIYDLAVKPCPEVTSDDDSVTVTETVGPGGEIIYDLSVPDSPPEVFIGSAQPDKADGFVVWFDPATCIVKFCNDAGDWFKPSNLLCQEEEPPCEKGECQFWYQPSSCCFSICCEGTWVGVNGATFQGDPTEGGGVVVVSDDGSVTINQSTNAAGDTVYNLTVPTDTVVDNGDGTGTMTQTDGTVCDFIKELPPIPEVVRAADPDCQWDDEGLASGAQVDAFIDQNLEFDSAALVGIANPCCNTVQGSTGGNDSDQCSQVSQSHLSKALGNRTSVISGWQNFISATSRLSIASGFQNTIDWGWDDFVTGKNNVLGGDGRADNNLVGGNNNKIALDANAFDNLVVGAGNQLSGQLGGANFNVVGGRDNILDQAAGNAVSGNQNQNIADVRYGSTTGGGNIVDGTLSPATFNDVSGAGNQVLGGSANIVGGGDNALVSTDSGSTYNLLVGQQNRIEALVTGNGSTTTGGANNNLVGGASNLNHGTRSLQVGTSNCNEDADVLQAGIANEIVNGRAGLQLGWGNTVDLVGGAFDSGYTTGHGVLKTVPNSDVSGFAAGVPAKGAGLTSNRTYQKEHQSGNVAIAGAFTAGFAFPDFGEYAVVDKNIKPGLFLVYEGLYKARVAKKGEDFDGVSRSEIPVAAGGGIDPDNNPWLVDEFGDRVIGDIDVTNVDLVVDEKATAKAQKEADKAVDKRNKEAKKANEDAVLEDYTPVVQLMTEVESTSVIQGPLKNPDFDPVAHAKLKTCGMSMMGRVFVQVSGDIKVGDYLEVGASGKGVKSDERTRARVLELKDNNAYISLR